MSRENKRKLIYEWDSKFLQMVTDHIAEGYSVSSFPGRYGIRPNCWLDWCREIPELREINVSYKKKVIFYKRFRVGNE